MNSASPAQAIIGAETLAIDCAREAAHIAEFLVQSVRRLNRRGVVLGISGGIDSAACAALAVDALGPGRVFGLLMPERDMVDDSHDRAERLCKQLGITYAIEDVGPSLEAIGCYQRRDDAIRTVVPDYGPDWKHKIVISPATEGMIAHFNIVVQEPGGELSTTRMPIEVYLQVVAATNFKQRIRKNIEYYHADRLNYAVLGTPNKLEYDLGFFVRGGDGLADIKPIAHLYKTQVYSMARHLGVPEEICCQLPSTNTYSLPQTQEEFYYALPYEKADIALQALLKGVAAAEVAPALGITAGQMEAVYRDFGGKRRAAERGLADALVLTLGNY